MTDAWELDLSFASITQARFAHCCTGKQVARTISWFCGTSYQDLHQKWGTDFGGNCDFSKSVLGRWIFRVKTPDHVRNCFNWIYITISPRLNVQWSLKFWPSETSFEHMAGWCVGGECARSARRRYTCMRCIDDRCCDAHHDRVLMYYMYYIMYPQTSYAMHAMLHTCNMCACIACTHAHATHNTCTQAHM